MAARIKRNPLVLGFLIIFVVAGLAFAWWTISPFFIRTNLVEGENIALPVTSQSGNLSAPTSQMETSPPVGDTAMMEGGNGAPVTGSFDRKDSIHYASGQAIITRQEDGSSILRLQDLAAANGPDLFVYVTEHPDPQNSEQLHQGGHNLGSLKATTGSFNYTLDPAIDASKLKSVVIYCRAFSVIFSTAKLQAP